MDLEDKTQILPDTVRVTAATLARIAAREALQEAGETETDAPGAEQLATHPVGSRCEVAPGGRRGVIRFVGCPGGIPRPLVGVELDMSQGEDVQTGSGWLDGVEYFNQLLSRPDAPVVWKQPKDVVSGEFPEIDPFAGLSDSDDN
ncbi:unnamed protein product [Polarella glacialis]|uniref:CAP-Gly domain-containing protein n=1 Tax=Polarella glacialis TaxID=89957 RepID=A0A813G026_POLGL|nr:unnamed protein product [Polarella glacialis]|mmetsp:Transcript_8620/g.13668  ORF Transcript_8620/g.13668 Transcript_8620/m.13668 type:complete len:145 (-) Transcript_8620:215-649(-)